MSRIRMLAAALLVAGLCMAMTGPAISQQDKAGNKKGPNVQASAAAPKETEKTKTLHALVLVDRLIQYGRNQKHAESLLVAAQIFHKIPTQKLDVGFKVTGEVKGKAATPPKVDNSPKALVAEANALSSTPIVKSLAAATLKLLDEVSPGAPGGARIGNFVIHPGQTITWNPIVFAGGQPAIVNISLNGAFGALVLEIRDEFGNVVAKDSVAGNYFQCKWTPAFTGPFTISASNGDKVAFNVTCAFF